MADRFIISDRAAGWRNPSTLLDRALRAAAHFASRSPRRLGVLGLFGTLVLAELLAHGFNIALGFRQPATAVAVVTGLVVLLIGTPLVVFALATWGRLARSSEQRRTSDARFRDGIDSMADGFLIADRQGCILVWNKSFERLLPRLAGRMRQGMTIEELATVLAEEYGPEDPASRARRARHLRAGFSAFDAPIEEAFDGRIVMTVHSRTSEGGTVSVFRDVTQLHLRAKSRFVANMSHELRTPLNTVIGYSEMLLEDAAGDGSTPQRVADLKSIRSAAKHLLALLNDVLDLSKAEAGRMELTTGPIELATFIAEIVSAAQGLVESNANTLWVEYAADLGVMIGDAAKLRQVLSNLLGNAAKFTRRGSIALMATRERDPAGDWIRFAVSDTGIGIDREDLANLLADFIQADPSIRSKYGGTGFGLSLSQRLCRVMGGEITAESTLGRGSCFTVRVPAKPPGGAIPES